MPFAVLIGIKRPSRGQWRGFGRGDEPMGRLRTKKPPSAATLARRGRRAQKEIELAAKIRALPDRRYGLIYADPNWRFEVYSRETGLERDASNHYPVSTLAEIKALDVPSLAAKDCVLALWGTIPLLVQNLEVMAAWGFEYRSHAVWVKDRFGLGFWFRGKHELLLIGVRGRVPAPAPGLNFPSVIEAKVREHSRKPEEAYTILESYFPTVPRVELFARPETARPGWDYWGPEAPPFGMGEFEEPAPKAPEARESATPIELPIEHFFGPIAE
jgi:N6-adenosine-specific RNA methylase IME4